MNADSSFAPPVASHMSSLHRTITGDVLVQHLKQDAQMIDPSLVAERGRSARTLVKEGPLRLTIMALAAGGYLPVHSADGPISIHVLEGEVAFLADDRDYPLRKGDVLVLAGGVEHAARSNDGAVFLLTVVHLAAADAAEQGSRRDPVHPLSESAKQRWRDDGGLTKEAGASPA